MAPFYCHAVVATHPANDKALNRIKSATVSMQVQAFSVSMRVPHCDWNELESESMRISDYVTLVMVRCRMRRTLDSTRIRSNPRKHREPLGKIIDVLQNAPIFAWNRIKIVNTVQYFFGRWATLIFVSRYTLNRNDMSKFTRCTS